MSITGSLTSNGFIVPYGLLKARMGDSFNTILAKLTLKYAPKMGAPKHAILYDIITYAGQKYIKLPRTLAAILERNKVLIVTNKLPKLTNTPIELMVDLYDNQTILVNHLTSNIFSGENIAAGRATAILNLKAGMGKTFVAAGLIAKLQMKTLYIVTNKLLLTQAIRDLKSSLNVSVAAFNPSGNSPIVTVIIINSALKLLNCDDYPFVILDEVHSYCSAKRRNIFKICTSHVVLGMSATTADRIDGFDAIAHKELALGGIIYAEKVEGFDYEEVQFDCRARIIKYAGPPDFTRGLTHVSTGKIFVHYMHNQYISDPNRLQIAVNELITLYDWRGVDSETHTIYVFAEEIEILKTARDKFIEMLTVSRADIAIDINLSEIELFTGGMTESKVNMVVETGRVFFSTYGYAGTGVSIQRATAIILLTPRRSNMKQIIGRILRRGSNPNIPRVVVDIVDVRTALKNQFIQRTQAYDLYGFNQEVINISVEV